MKSSTVLQVLPSMKVTVKLEMTVQEMDAILESINEISRWPMWEFKEVLRQSLTAARKSYDSEHVRGEKPGCA